MRLQGLIVMLAVLTWVEGEGVDDVCGDGCVVFVDV
jgi:hypothetical protein